MNFYAYQLRLEATPRVCREEASSLLKQESKAIIKAIETTLVAIRTRRNQTMAHLDARPFADPAGYVSAGRVSYRQLDELFERTSEILNRFSLLYRDATVPLVLEDAKDYERAIDLLAAAENKFSRAAGST